MKDKNYALRYTFNEEWRKEGYSEEDSIDGKGLCDAIIGISIILPDDGGYSQLVFSSNGKTKGSCTQDEIFKAWMVLGLSLHDENRLTGWKSECVQAFSYGIRELFKFFRENNKK